MSAVVQLPSEDCGDEEQDNVDDAEHPRNLEHRAVLLDGKAPAVTA